MEPLDLIVVGAGISGMAIAARACAAGLRVAVVEQHATVGQGASFAHSGFMLPSPLDAWFGPGPRESDPGGLPWQRKRRLKAADTAHWARYANLADFAELSSTVLAQVVAEHELEFEARSGGLYLFHSPSSLARAKALCAEWPSTAPEQTSTSAQTPDESTEPVITIKHRLLTREECVAIEPALESNQTLCGGILLDKLQSGNCALAAKRLKTRLDEKGVVFMLAREATALHIDTHQATVALRPATAAAGAFLGVRAAGFAAPSPDRLFGGVDVSGNASGIANSANLTTPYSGTKKSDERITATRVVLAAGSNTAALLATTGLSLPLRGRSTRVITGAIAHIEHTPRRILVDADQGIGIVRFEHRLRIGTTVDHKPGVVRTEKQSAAMIQALHQCADDRVPGAARLNSEAGSAQYLCGADGLPVIGALSFKGSQAAPRQSAAAPVDQRLFVSFGASVQGWAMAFGAADVIVKTILGEAVDPRHTVFSPQRFG